MTVVIRQVRRGDIIGITRVVLAARGWRGAELEQQMERDLARFRAQGITEQIEAETLVAMDGSRMVGVLRYGEFDSTVHLTRPEVDPQADLQQVTAAFLQAFWSFMSREATKAVFIDYPEPLAALPTLGSLFVAGGFAKLVERTDMRLQLTLPIAPQTDDLRYASYDQQTHERFLRVFKASFRDSLDPMMEWDAAHPEQSFLMFRDRFGVLEPSLWVLATDQNGQDVGFALFQHFQSGRYQGDTMLLYMAVLPEARGRGYGAEIVREGLRRVRALRGSRAHVVLTVSKPNTPAAGIYQKIGFLPVETFTVYRMTTT